MEKAILTRSFATFFFLRNSAGSESVCPARDVIRRIRLASSDESWSPKFTPRLKNILEQKSIFLEILGEVLGVATCLYLLKCVEFLNKLDYW